MALPGEDMPFATNAPSAQGLAMQSTPQGAGVSMGADVAKQMLSGQSGGKSQSGEATATSGLRDFFKNEDSSKNLSTNNTITFGNAAGSVATAAATVPVWAWIAGGIAALGVVVFAVRGR